MWGNPLQKINDFPMFRTFGGGFDCGRFPRNMKQFRISFVIFAASIAFSSALRAVPVVIVTPGGAVELDISHAGPTGQLEEPDPPANAGFRPPTIFAAPLPVGSGARALGQAGAFTAVADDATAASWNPAGLVQLEFPEVSAVYRFSAEKDAHESQTSALESGDDGYASSELNYLSAVYPFLLNDRNAVVSLNYQEAYDYTYEFTARFSGQASQNIDTNINQTFVQSTNLYYSDVNQSLTIVADVTTAARSDIHQVLNSTLLSSIDFRQEGTIDALSPAFALDVTPQFSLGIAVNLYTDGASRGNPIESTLVAEYSGSSDSISDITTTRSSTAVNTYSGERYTGDPSDPITIPVPEETVTNTFSDVQTNVQVDAYTVAGIYREDNDTEDFHGINATLGALWAASEKLTIGATVDLPWTGYGKQTKRVDHQVSTFDSNLVQVANTVFRDAQTRDVEYTFPLYWSVGALWRWSDRLYISMDTSRTYWSEYSYKAEGEARINPVNGEPHSSSMLDDCWSIRLGGEYVCVLSQTEIPLRGGMFWEQRPAVGAPDEYWGFSLGSGISLGKETGKTILDVAYIFEQGNNVRDSLLAGQAVRSDVTKHQLFVSAIWHF